MSAENLREAASLMRERALTATDGPWTHGPHFQRANCASVFAGKRTEGHYLAMYATPADAEHIASWCPAVALTVADWLEVTARDVGTSSFAFHAAIKVARAYLGRSA